MGGTAATIQECLDRAFAASHKRCRLGGYDFFVSLVLLSISFLTILIVIVANRTFTGGNALRIPANVYVEAQKRVVCKTFKF